jgi:hypothetical protein
MSEALLWDDLTRPGQRALIKLFGGGSLRNDGTAVVNELRSRGFIDENNALAMPGLFVLTNAIRRHRAKATSRMELRHQLGAANSEPAARRKLNVPISSAMAG